MESPVWGGRGNTSGPFAEVGVNTERCPAARCRWPTRFQRSLEQLKDGDSREQKERSKVVLQLEGALQVAGLWTPEEAGDGQQGLTIAHQRIAMGRRLSTLRQHVRNICKMTQYCRVSYGRGWFSKPREFFDLIAARLAEPCGRHVPRCLLNSVVFAEQAAEIREEHRLSKEPGIRNFLREVEASGGWKSGKVVKKAQPFSVVMILSLEDLVMRTAAAPQNPLVCMG